MATMNGVIEYTDRIRPNVFTDEDKYKWLNTLEGLVAREVQQAEEPSYVLPQDADKELLIPHPYDDIYQLYLLAMIDLANREYDHYNNAVLVFTNRYEQYKAWYIRHNPSCKALNFRNVMG